MLMRAVASGSYDSLVVLNDTDSTYTDTGQDGHLVNGQEYHYVVVPRDTSNLESPANDTLTIIPIGGTIALMDSDTTMILDLLITTRPLCECSLKILGMVTLVSLQ